MATLACVGAKEATGREHVDTRERLRSQWRSRPVPLRIYAGMSLVLLLFSFVRDPGLLAFPKILLTLVSLALLALLWSGSAGMWWLSVLANGISAAFSLAAASEHPFAWVDLVLSAVSLILLVHPSTRAWFNERIAERYP